VSVTSDARILMRLSTEAVLRRWDRGTMRSLLRRRGPLPEGHFTAALYFADFLVNTYQIEQWREPLLRLAEYEPLVVIARDIRMTRHLLEHFPLPVYYAADIAEVELWLRRQQVRAVFYVNQNNRNFPMLRFREPAHIFLSHGESDKDYMASNQLKAYDYTFVAGPAAKQRLSRLLIDYDVDARAIEIGRPQVDCTYSGPRLPDDGRTTVIYAPTWEGDRPSMGYSSLLSHGPALVRALTGDPGYRIVYRPHPRTGISDHRFQAGHRSLVATIEAANRADPAARHLVDIDTPFGWHLRSGDVCISDISAVAYDWMATGKPLVLTRPVAPLAAVDRNGLAARLDPLPADRAGQILQVIARERADTGRYRAIVHHYFGDTSPGSSMQRFLTAARQVITERSAALHDRHPAGPGERADRH